MSTRTVPESGPGTGAHRPADRLVTLGHRGAWEVRTPGPSAAILYAEDKRTAIEWAWNITQDTGGTVVVHPPGGCGA